MSLPIIEPKNIPMCAGMFFQGKSDVDIGIRFLSDSRVNHFGLWTGKGIAQEIGKGYLEQGLDEAISDTDVYVNIVQFCGDPSHMFDTYLGSKEYPYEPVLESCQALLKEGDMYDFPSLLLLAALCEVRRLENGNIYQRLLLDKLFDTISSLIESTKIFQLIESIVSQGKRPMDCSASGYLCFVNAGEKYRPAILPQSMHDIYNSLPTYTSEVLKKFEDVWKAEQTIPYKFITPSDLWMSPNFCKYVGRLHYGNLQLEQ